MHARRINDEVYVADESLVKVSRESITELKRLAGQTHRQRVRLCAHQRTEDRLHEMLIVLSRGTYVRPHRHVNKTESFHVVEGALTVVLFTDAGQIREVIRMGTYASGLLFYYRLAEPAYHTVLLDSDLAVIHETTNGPFNRLETEFAFWAPPEESPEESRRYQVDLVQRVSRLAA